MRDRARSQSDFGVNRYFGRFAAWARFVFGWVWIEDVCESKLIRALSGPWAAIQTLV